MKRVVILVVSLILFLAIPATVFVSMRNQELRKKAAPATTLTLAPTTITKTVNEEFTLEARMDTAENQIVAVELNITFDPAKLQAEWIHNGTMFPNILSSGTVGNGTASIALGATNTTTPITGTGTVATIKFKALAATSAPVAVRFSSDTFVGALNEGSTNALTSSVPSTITITGSEGATPTPTTASSITPTITLTPTLTPTNAASDSASTSAVTVDRPIKNSSVITTQPTILGKAPAGSTVTITVYSDPITVTVTADANGNWTYTLAEPLVSGPHTIVVAAQDPDTGTSHTATLAFVVATGDENGASGSAVPVSGSTENTMILLGLGMLFILTGSMVPHLRRLNS